MGDGTCTEKGARLPVAFNSKDWPSAVSQQPAGVALDGVFGEPPLVPGVSDVHSIPGSALANPKQDSKIAISGE